MRPTGITRVILLAAFLALATGSGCEPAASSGRLRELELPRGFLDLPLEGAVPQGDVVVAGWAVAPDGIEDVAVYVNGRYVDSAALGFSRPDVARAEPTAPGASTSGFRAIVAAADLPGGEVTLVVQARSRLGATRDVGAVRLVIPTSS